MQTNVSDKFNAWIFESFKITDEGLALYRIFVASMILFFLMPPSSLYSYLGALPDDFYNPPPGPMMLFSSFPPAEFLWAVHILLTGSVIAMFLGFYTKWSSLLTGILMLVLKGFIYSIGKINHDLLIALVPLVFAFSHWGKAYSFDAIFATGSPGSSPGHESVDSPNGWPFSLLALFIGFMFFTAGFPKILGGWLDLSTQATRGHFFNQYFPKDRTDLLADTALGIDSVFFWEFLDVATIVFEVGFLIAILNPVTTRIFICIAVIFHFSTMMIMNIAFLFNFIAYAAFINWDWLNARVHSIVERVFPSRVGDKGSRVDRRSAPGWLWGTGLAGFFGIILLASQFELFVDQSDLVTHEVIMLFLAFVIAVYGLWSGLSEHLMLKTKKQDDELAENL